MPDKNPKFVLNPPDRFLHYDPPSAAPGFYYRAFRKYRWKGPHYFSQFTWLEDLFSVYQLLEMMARSAAPLPQGLEVAAVDAQTKVSRRQKPRMRGAGIFIGALALLGLFLARLSFQLYGQEEVILALFLVAYIFAAPLLLLALIIPKTRKQAVLLHMRDKLESGDQLSDVMREMNHFFPGLHAELVGIAEESGQLGKCLGVLCERMQQGIESRRALSRTFIFSMMNALALMGVTAFLVIKVFPVFNEIQLEFNEGMPSSSALGAENIMYIGARLLDAMLIIIVVAVVFRLYLGLFRRREWGTAALSNVALALPWLRGLLQHINLQNIAMSLEMLLRAGVPLQRALLLVSNADLNPLYARALRRSAERVEQGESLADALARHKQLFTARFVEHARLGEYSGQLPEELSLFFQSAQGLVERRTRIFFDMQQPLITLFLGSLVALVAVYAFNLLIGISDMAVMW